MLKDSEKKKRRISAVIVVIRSPPLFFQNMGDNFLAEISWETAVIAAEYLRNAGNRPYFSTKYRRFRFFPPSRRYRRKISVKISTRVRTDN